jgi:hypothetical protein
MSLTADRNRSYGHIVDALDELIRRRNIRMSKREKRHGEQGGQPQPGQQWPQKQGGSQPGQQWPSKPAGQPEKTTTWPTQPGQGR